MRYPAIAFLGSAATRGYAPLSAINYYDPYNGLFNPVSEDSVLNVMPFLYLLPGESSPL